MFLRVIAAWLLPPLGVFLQVGLKGQFWLNVVLSLFFWIPGVLHAVWVVAVESAGQEEGQKDFWRLLAAFFLPPLGVAMQSGVGANFLINCVLTLFFWLPGQLHATWVICAQR